MKQAASANRFARHPLATAAGIVTALVIVLIIIAELMARSLGLGDPIIYETDPLYKYRPRANQTVHRLGGAVIHINDIGIRANDDWGTDANRKVLFVGNSVTYGGSYVSNDDIFAIRAVPRTNGWVGGSGGVNGWGVENMHALIVERRFNPAKVYVTVLLKSDFFRGTSPRRSVFPTTRPRLALAEAVPHVVLRARERVRQLAPSLFVTHKKVSPAEMPRALAERAVVRLKEMDEYLKGQGFVHLIYMSPTIGELKDLDDGEGIEINLLAAGIAFQRIQNRPEARAVPREMMDALYKDGYHLSKAGHELWATIIGKDLRACGVGGTKPLDCSAVPRYTRGDTGDPQAFSR
ncbi:MAG TPA: hypothetical protein VHM24_14410 [Gemmatimonadaceae bacterium]|nr:hypothetical protein [Gemmatimonadaceae bacterium]